VLRNHAPCNTLQHTEAHLELKSLHFDFERMIVRHDTATLQHCNTLQQQQREAHLELKSLHFDVERMIARHDTNTATLQHCNTATPCNNNSERRTWS